MLQSFSVQSIKTPIFSGRSLDELAAFIVASVPNPTDGMILAITSKIVSIAEGCIVPRGSTTKTDLVHKEADIFLGEIGHGTLLTIKHGLFIASAGIDESNSQSGDFITYPRDPFATSEFLWRRLREAWSIKNLGLVLTDSRTSPMRYGVTGVSLAHWGFHALQDLVGTRDLFGKPLQMTKVNLADGLAAAATMTMGEANECRPLAVIDGAALTFTANTRPSDLIPEPENDLYYPIWRPDRRS